MDSFYARADESNDMKIPFDGLHNSSTNTSSTSSKMTSPPSSVHRSKNDGVVPDFIQKLFNMLESTDETSCYHWGRQGTAFVIDDTNEFAKTVLPSRFKHSNFSSFVRQLNKYDFHKIRFTDNQSSSSSSTTSSSSAQQQAWEFQHPLFRRDKKHLLSQIRRKGNNHPVKKHQQSTINNKTSPAASPPLPFDNTKVTTTITTPDPSATAIAELHELHSSLQTQIDKLSSAQQAMASTLGRLVTTDTLLLNELQGMKRKMDEKDSILSTLLDLPPAKKQQTLDSNQQDYHHPSSLYLKHEPSLSVTTPSSASTVTTPLSSNESYTLQHPPIYPTTTTATSLPSSPTNAMTTSTKTVTIHPAPSVPSNVVSTTTNPTTTTTTTTPPPPPTTCHPWRHRPKVLVVEDNDVYRRISKRCLERLGCTFDMACDGLEAVTWMKQQKYDLILMDISIPKLDGMAATRKLRQYDQHTPVVSMTANYSDVDIQNYVGSGMSDLLPKPFDQHKLYDIIKQHCAHLI